ncbi:MAG TPA: alpha/beta hydrolase [Actinomycetales bacterium]
MRASVDVEGLHDLATALGLLGARLAAATAPVAAAVRSAAGSSAAAPALAHALRGRERVLEDLRALRAVVVLAAARYAQTEARVVALVDGARIRALLGRTRPVVLEQLLTAPLLSAVVLARPAGDDGTGDHQLVDELTRTLLLGPGAAARRQHQLLAAIDPARRRVLALLHPRLLTAMAGAPPTDRFAASRVLVAADLARLLGEWSRAWRPGVTHSERQQLFDQMTLRRRLLHGEVVLRHPGGAITRHPRQLLSFDPAGDGRVVEVVGDLARARHLAVFVPGTGSDLRRQAGSLARMTPFAAADPELAVVLWQGADHPDQPFDEPFAVPRDPADLPAALRRHVRHHVAAAAYRDAADVAGPLLAAEVAGLRAAVPAARADLTVLGHSYGGSVVGSAEVTGMVAARVLHVAGAGAYADGVHGYALPQGPQRFSMTAPDDPVQLAQGVDAGSAGSRAPRLLPPGLGGLAPVAVPLVAELLGDPDQIGHGADPDELRDVVRLDTGVHDDGSLVSGHSAMFEPGSTAWRNLLAVMTRGQVSVLEPHLWSTHLEPARLVVEPGGGGGPDGTPDGGADGGPVAGGSTVRVVPPRYVVDRSPYEQPTYRPPVLDLGAG